MANAQDAKLVVVTGDLTMDWNLACTGGRGGSEAAWNVKDTARLYGQRGGAAMLGDLIEAVAADLGKSGAEGCEVRRPAVRGRQVRPGNPEYHHSYALWAPFAYSASDAKAPKVWRVEAFLGLDHPASENIAEGVRVEGDPPEADLVVLDDAALGFRDRPDAWPQAVREGRCRWVLLKIARPVADGQLWEHLHRTLADRLIVVMTVNDLRLTEVQISRELSWERTAQDLAWELVHNPRVKALSECARVVVSFDTAGAFLLSRQADGGAQGRLLFDPAVVEGEWPKAYPGRMVGYTSCLTAGIARQVMAVPDQPDLEAGIQAGMAAMRKLHQQGYGARGGSASSADLAFPVQAVAAELAGDARPLTSVEVQDPVRGAEEGQGGPWTILRDRFPKRLEAVAGQIVREGPEVALKGVPLGRFGYLLTVDRQEIEAFRSVRALVLEYSRTWSQKPISIAVFGSPGSGKSFGVSEAAKSLLPGEIQELTFNLSQFEGPKDLLDAFHQVRDAGIGGKLPLVFFDEFDTSLGDQKLGWLAYFLAPMQNGTFQEGQVTHPIGRAIFVFAGGTSARIEDFGKGLSADELRQAKGPDFLSRLKGFINILGPNPDEGREDPYAIIRRAILLRSMLRRGTPGLFSGEILNMDSGVLRAFLLVRRYRHGARSMESILSMSALSGKGRYERSSLPSEAQLNLHVNGVEFLSLVQMIPLEGDTLERLAETVHEKFCETMKAQGYLFGPVTDDGKKTHSSLRAFAELPVNEQEQNRGNAQDIPRKLAVAGYVMISARSTPPPFNFPDVALEDLAEMEHDRWMMGKLGDGWRWAKETDKVRKLHRALLPWRALTKEEKIQKYSAAGAEAVGDEVLPESEKEKDRALVREIPEILAKIGYAVVKSSA